VIFLMQKTKIKMLSVRGRFTKKRDGKRGKCGCLLNKPSNTGTSQHELSGENQKKGEKGRGGTDMGSSAHPIPERDHF